MEIRRLLTDEAMQMSGLQVSDIYIVVFQQCIYFGNERYFQIEKIASKLAGSSFLDYS